MKRLRTLLFMAVFAVALIGGASARADISWSAEWTTSNLVLTTVNGSKISLFNLTTTNMKTTPDLPTIPVTVANAAITTFAGSPDHFSDLGYDFTVHLTEGSETKTLTFTGTLSGLITQSGSLVVNHFGPLASQTTDAYADGTTIKVDLNAYLTIKEQNPLIALGGFGADITAVADNTAVAGNPGSGQPHGTPEPSTLALGSLGMAFTGLLAWRRRRTQAP